ncbi:MAG: S8 family serine peptidase, partial [Candidatus Kapabacteria bacterium]|nr:S8 family serine peptidase [Candidatus Kapabacteria bacterium]
VVNMSFGDGVDSPMLRDAVLFAASMNVVLIASAGNAGTTSRQYPAGYDNVIAVGSTNEEDRRSPFSSTGSLVALCAPGEKITTTAVNSRYRTVNGTSFSAPYVAAAAAMLIEQSPTITSAEIRGTLQERSLDLGDRGWDIFYGAGRIQVDAALRSAGRSSFGISWPKNEMEIDARTTPSLAIIGSVLVAPFDSFAVEIGNGIEPTAWAYINSSNLATTTDTLAQLNVATRSSGLYTLRLKVYCKDGRTLDDRKRITIVNGEPLTILHADIIQAWTTDRRSPVVSIRSSRPTSLTLNIMTENELKYTDVRRFVRSHSVTLPDTIVAQTQYQVLATCMADNGSTVDTTLTIAGTREGAPTIRGWNNIASEQWSGYVLNDVRDMYGDGAPTIVMNDLSSGTFGSTFTMQYRNGVWTRRDSLTSSWIPRGISDANGNGLLEVLMHVVGRAVLFEQSKVGGSPFARIIYADSSGKQNGAGVADINGDGREELLLLSDSGCTAITFRNGAFERLGIAVNSSQPSFGNSNNRVDEISVGAGDFDGDGKMDVAFADTDGDLIISEWDGSGFVNRFILETSGGGGSGFVATGDVDANGRPDVAFGVPDSTQPDAQHEYGRNVWTYRLIRSTSNDSYETMWKDHFSGVRYGIGYRSGVGLGNLNRRAGDEIVICVYPRMYVFGYDAATQRIATQWYVPDVVCPRFLMYDFNNNGINELGYGTTSTGLGIMTGFRFSEMDTATHHPAPTSLRGHYSNTDTIALDWMPVPNTINYIVYSSVNNGPFRKLDSTTSTALTTAVPSGASSIRYEVVAYPTDTTIRESQRSNVASFVIGSIVSPVGIDRDTVSPDELSRGLQIEVLYNGDVSVEHLEPTRYRLVDELTGNFIYASSAVAGTQKNVLLTFASFSQPAQLILTVMPVTDTRERLTLPVNFEITIQSGPSSTPDFALASLVARSATSLRVRYTTNVDASALIAQNYTLSPIGSIVSCSRVDGSSVDLQLDPTSPLTARGITYALTARNILGDPSGVITKGAGNTATFIVTADDVREAYVYPHPVRISRDQEITFAGLTKDATVEVLDGSMRSLIVLTSTEGNGGVRWDLRTTLGAKVSPGLYFYRVRDTINEGEDVLKKLFIER